MKAIADDNFIVAQMVRFLLDKIENIIEKGEYFGYQHFLLFQQCFQRAFPKGHKKSSLCGVRQIALELFPKRQVLDSSKPTDFADDNSKFDEFGN